MQRINKATLLIRRLSARLSPKQFIILSSILVGLWSGMLAVCLKVLAHQIMGLASHVDISIFIHALFPLAGLALTVLFVKIFLGNKMEKGSYNVLYAIGRRSSKIEKSQTYSHIITSALTVGLGGSAGLESPIVQTGAAIGANYGEFFAMNYRDRTLLLGCGAAAGIATAFNAPIAGVVFALEVLLVNVSVSAFIPLLIAGATGALCSKIFLNEGIILSVQTQLVFDHRNLPFYVVMGLVSGVFSVYYTRSYLRVDNFFTKKFKNQWVRVLMGGLLLAILILLFPPLFGEGYTSVMSLTHLKPSELRQGSVLQEFITGKTALVLFISAITILKVWATGITLSCGGNGGNFAPALYVGGFLGYLFAIIVNFFNIGYIPEINFILVGMAGILSGIFHAPLTGIFLIAEITGGYNLMIPLMIVSALSYTVARRLEHHTLDSAKLAQKGHRHTTDRDTNILSTLATSSLIEKDFKPISSEGTLGDLVKIVAKSRRNLFPVLDAEENLVGVIILDNIREIMFDTQLYDTIRIKEIMHEPPALLDINEDMLAVMNKFDRTEAWNLPVVDGKQYVGFVSKASIFSEYRRILQQTTIE